MTHLLQGLEDELVRISQDFSVEEVSGVMAFVAENVRMLAEFEDALNQVCEEVFEGTSRTWHRDHPRTSE